MKPLNIVGLAVVAALIFALVSQTWLASSRGKDLVIKEALINQQAADLSQRNRELVSANLARDGLQAKLDSLTTQHLKNSDQTEQAVEQVRKEYAQKPVTPDNVAKKEQTISQIKLQGLWRAYCIGQLDPNCEAK